MKDIRGSHAIVTGASRGIGTYIAKTLAAQGVSLTLRHPEKSVRRHPVADHGTAPGDSVVIRLSETHERDAS